MHEKASASVAAHGFQLRVPTVVAACVEEIYRRGTLMLCVQAMSSSLTCHLVGMKMADLFVVPPNRKRIFELVAACDQLTNATPLPDLRKESIHDVAHLLAFWIKMLPMPLFHRTFFDAFSAWCVEPSLTREQEYKHKIHTRQCKGDDGEYHSETDTEAEAESEEDEACVGLPSFNSRKKRLRRKQRAIERAKRRAFAAAHPDQVISNRPSHQQRRAQMYRELQHLETPQVNHARLLIMLIAPHCYSVMLYLLTFFASLLDYPSNKLTAKILAEKFAWKLLGGPNKEVSRELMEWLLTRWDRVSHGFKSEVAVDWEKKREAERKSGDGPRSCEQTGVDAAPQYESGRRGSGESGRSAAPSYHSTCPPQGERRGSDASSSSSTPGRRRRRSDESGNASSRRSSASSAASDNSASRPTVPALRLVSTTSILVGRCVDLNPVLLV